MSTITVQNESGQVSSFTVDGPRDPRATVLQQRINRGELKVVSDSTKSTTVAVAVVEIDEGVRDEKGDLLKSIHGGGIDPDAAGDAMGDPSGSGLSEKEATAAAAVAAEAVAQQVSNAEGTGAEVSPTTLAAAAAAAPAKAAKK